MDDFRSPYSVFSVVAGLERANTLRMLTSLTFVSVAVTAFIVVNIRLAEFQWVLWIVPSIVGTILITRTIRFYKVKFNGKAA